jgi:hypothetical protein
MTSTTDVPESRCPSCGKLCDAATAVEKDNKPSPGDFSVCLDCGHVMIFDHDLRLRELRGEEFHTIAGDKELLLAQQFAALYRKSKPNE